MTSSASQRGADPAQIKAAWRRLARANHPDLTGDDPAASRVATRRMAEINDAYAALTREAAPTGAAATATARTRMPPAVAPRRPAAPEADPAGHRPGRHDRHLPAAQPDDDAGHRPRQRRPRVATGVAGPPDRPAAAPRRTGPRGAAARLDADRAARAGPAAPLPPPGRPRSTARASTSSSSASSTATRSARSRLSSRRTSTGSPARSPATRTSSPRRASSRRTSMRGVSGAGPTRRRREPHRTGLTGPRTDPGNARSPPGYPGGRSMRDESAPDVDQCCRPDGLTGLMAEDPVTRLVTGTRDPSLEPPRESVRSPFRDRRPRLSPVRSRVGL